MPFIRYHIVVLLLLLGLGAVPAGAQVPYAASSPPAALPPTNVFTLPGQPSSSSYTATATDAWRYPGQLTNYTGSAGSAGAIPGPVPPGRKAYDGPLPKTQSDLPPGARDGMFQKLLFDATWLAAGGAGGLGMMDLDLKVALALPIPSRKSPLLIIPGFGVHYLDGPLTPDLPPQVFDAYTMFRWRHDMTDRLRIDLAVTPGVFSDFEQGTDDAIRVTGHGFGVYKWTKTTKIVLGATYLDRDDISVLPIAGVIWEPNRGYKFDLVFPHPKIYVRLFPNGPCNENEKDWLTLAGEFGEGVWAIERASGALDKATYRDWRLILGLEHESIGGLGYKLEIGYVFSRTMEYQSATPDFEPSSTLLMRAGFIF